MDEVNIDTTVLKCSETASEYQHNIGQKQSMKRKHSPEKDCHTVQSVSSNTENSVQRKKFTPTIPTSRHKNQNETLGQHIEQRPIDLKRDTRNFGSHPNFNQHHRPSFNQHHRPPFNQHHRPPFNQHQKHPFNQHQRPPFNQNQRHPLNQNQRHPFNQHQRPHFNQPFQPHLSHKQHQPLHQQHLQSYDHHENKQTFTQQRYKNSDIQLNKKQEPYIKPDLVQTEGCLFGSGVHDNEKSSKRKGKSQTEKCHDEDPVLAALNVIDNYEMFGNSDRNFPAPLLLDPLVRRHAIQNEPILKDMAQLILEKDIDENCQEMIIVHPHLAEKLKYHQVEGVQFMWNACFKSKAKSGCVLAHCMGLGKSLQVVTLAHTVLTSASCEVTRVMIVCPVSTVLNWQNEFNIWFPKETMISIFELASSKNNKTREDKVKKWFEIGGILIIGYEMFRTLTKPKEKKKTTSKKDAKGVVEDVYQRCLVNPGPHVIFCDEGHLLKNEESELYKAMNLISTQARIMLTGTPLQNSLFEYYTMVQFVNPGLLGTKVEFSKRFVYALQKGQAADSTPEDVRAMKRRALILHKLLENKVQRFDSSVLSPFLPPKYEYVVSVRMSDLQIKLYCHYLENFTKGGSTKSVENQPESAGLFSDFQELSRVWTHPKALLLAFRRREAKNTIQGKPSTGKKKATKKDNFEEDEIFPDETDFDRIDTQVGMDRMTSSNVNLSWWSDLITDADMNHIGHSGKLILLLDILQQCEVVGDKLLVFSQSLTSLDLIEEFLALEDFRNQARSATDTTNKSIGTWCLDSDYFRLDGSSLSEQRQKWCSAFNDPLNTRARLFLISTRAGGIGINLVGANRAIIFDASWNPSQDLQSVFRVYRLGQKKPCYIYRFVAQGTMEEKVYYRQVAKLALSRCIVDDEQMERYFGSGDLTDLYSFNADGLLSLSDPMLWPASSLSTSDTILTKLAVHRKEWIGAYREHDSLLQNRPEEYLEMSEQQAIWNMFEKGSKPSN